MWCIMFCMDMHMHLLLYLQAGMHGIMHHDTAQMLQCIQCHVDGDVKHMKLVHAYNYIYRTKLTSILLAIENTSCRLYLNSLYILNTVVA